MDSLGGFVEPLMKCLVGLSADEKLELFGHSAACVAVFRCLYGVPQQLILRMLYIDVPLDRALMISWFKPGSQSDCAKAIEELVTLNILEVLQSGHEGAGDKQYKLNQQFAEWLQFSFGHSDYLRGLVEVHMEGKQARSVEELRTYAKERWESVLYYLSLSSDSNCQVSTECREVLQSADFIRLDGASSSVDITSKGFQFLLMDPHLQIWTYLLLYLKYTQAKGVGIVECLGLLFRMSFAELGKGYSSEGFTESLQNFLQHLREIGLVFQTKRKSMRFLPTHLAVNLLVDDSRRIASDDAPAGGLVVETNFRVYAYTDSPLQLTIISLFGEMMYRFPGMSVCALTRESVRKALQAGISANQIIDFLRANAHVQILSSDAAAPLIPPNIIDQIRLWEMERERFTFAESVLYSGFLSDVDYEMIRDHAQDLDVVLWRSDSKRNVVVTPEGHAEVKKFWKRNKKAE